VSDDLRIRVHGKAEDTVSLGVTLGLEPYILTTFSEDPSGTMRFDIEVGGGVPVDTETIATLFAGLAEALDEGDVTASNVPGVEVTS